MDGTGLDISDRIIFSHSLFKAAKEAGIPHAVAHAGEEGQAKSAEQEPALTKSRNNNPLVGVCTVALAAAVLGVAVAAVATRRRSPAALVPAVR